MDDPGVYDAKDQPSPTLILRLLLPVRVLLFQLTQDVLHRQCTGHLHLVRIQKHLRP